MYRIVFFKIPFMRGGYRVPVCPIGTSPILHMGKFKVLEIITNLAFSEQQREIVISGNSSDTIDSRMANYMYIAYTDTNTPGDYDNDKRPAYYWVDDVQFVGSYGVEEQAPAAVVTISPDVWLTDFCSGQTTVRGRLAQSTVNIATMPRTPVIQPYYDIDNTVQRDALPLRPSTGNNYWAVGVFATNDGGILTYAIPESSWALLRGWANAMGSAAKITQTPRSGSGSAITLNVDCIKLYILPAAFVEYGSGISIFSRDSLFKHTLETAGGAVYDDLYIPSYDGGPGLLKTLTVTLATYQEAFLSLEQKSWLVTPARFIELSAARGMVDRAGNYIPPASVYVSIAGSGDDGVKLYLQTGEEFIDISDDYAADFAANTAAVQQAQQKQLIALQAITGVIGAVGGAAGGVASGNYFGAVQSIAGGVQSIAQIAAARKSPAQIRGNGGVASFFAMTQTLLLAVSLGNPINIIEFQKVENEYGWQYDDAPYYNDALEYDNYYRFTEVEIDGDITGGQGAQQEMANALVSGVRLVDISKL